ncbi:MAG: ATP-binding cassette domain-containing protein [Bacteroidota bacterium]
MEIILENIGKKYYQRWLFRHLSFKVETGQKWLIKGPNGSGKSTLLQIMAGAVGVSEGKVSYRFEGNPVSGTQVYTHLAWAAPGLSLYTDLSLRESISLHFTFKSCLLDDPLELAKILDLEAHIDKPLKFFSSGMLQRLAVGLALVSDTPLLLLDEPTSNLDTVQARKLITLIEKFSANRTLILASNLEREAKNMTHFWELQKAV